MVLADRGAVILKSIVLLFWVPFNFLKDSLLWLKSSTAPVFMKKSTPRMSVVPRVSRT